MIRYLFQIHTFTSFDCNWSSPTFIKYNKIDNNIFIYIVNSIYIYIFHAFFLNDKQRKNETCMYRQID